jgi:hypothetical protein
LYSSKGHVQTNLQIQPPIDSILLAYIHFEMNPSRASFYYWKHFLDTQNHRA